MRKLFLTLLMATLPYMIVNAQSRMHELGLSYSGTNLFGVRYKFGNEKSLLRLTLLSAGVKNNKRESSNSESKSNDQRVALNIGFQRLTPITDDLSFYFGPEFMSDLETHTYENFPVYRKTIDKTFTTGLGCVLGFAYYFSNYVNLSAEITPSIWYSATKSATSGASVSKSNSKSFGYGFNSGGNSFANLTLSFRLHPRREQ